MNKRKVIKIDLNVWTTQTDKAKETGQKLSTISRQVKNSKDGTTPNPIPIFDIPELGITLVLRN